MMDSAHGFLFFRLLRWFFSSFAIIPMTIRTQIRALCIYIYCKQYLDE